MAALDSAPLRFSDHLYRTIHGDFSVIRSLLRAKFQHNCLLAIHLRRVMSTFLLFVCTRTETVLVLAVRYSKCSTKNWHNNGEDLKCLDHYYHVCKLQTPVLLLHIFLLYSVEINCGKLVVHDAPWTCQH